MGGLHLSCRTGLSVLIVCVLLTAAAAGVPAKAAEPVTPDKLDGNDPAWTLCREAAHEVNQSVDMPDRLLAAISTTETGITNRVTREVTPWPWTINVRGQGYRYATKEDAVAATRAFMAKGIRSIDVGCMQVNLKYHPRAFTSLEEAFDPAANATYASEFLAHLRARRSSWPRTIQSYHAYAPDEGVDYRTKVDEYWAAERRRAAAEEANQKAALHSRLKQIAQIQSKTGLKIPSLTDEAGTSPLPLEALRLLPVQAARVEKPETVFIALALAQIPVAGDGAEEPIRISQADGEVDGIAVLLN